MLHSHTSLYPLKMQKYEIEKIFELKKLFLLFMVRLSASLQASTG